MIAPERIEHALQNAFDQLRAQYRDPNDPLRAALLVSTGLSAPMIEWALNTSLPRSVEVLRAARSLAPVPTQVDRTLSVVLAGNLFTACIRALAWPLLLGWRVTAKAASADDVLPRALATALRAADAEVGERLAVVTFDRTDTAALHALVRNSDAVSVYGSDATINAIQNLLDRSTPLIAHGHGVGAAFVERGAIRGRVQRMLWAERLALDIAAYDQRGCLSPQVILVDSDDPKRTHKLALNLSAALSKLEGTLPRGPLPEEAAIAQSQWRNTLAACGDVIEGTTHTVAITGIDMDPTAMLGPGYRNVLLVPCSNAQHALALLEPWGQTLKALGVAPDGEALTRVLSQLSPQLRPNVSAAGTMQTPTFDARADGETAWHLLA